MAELTDAVDLASLDDALALAAPRLDRTGQQVAVAAYRTLAEGRPGAVSRIASSAGVDEHTVERLLDEWGAVFRDDEGHVVGFWGLDGDGRLHDLSHPESALSFLRPDREWDDQVMATFCHHVLHFTGPGTAREWIADHPGTFVLVLDDAVEFARLHTDRCFGEALR